MFGLLKQSTASQNWTWGYKGLHFTHLEGYCMWACTINNAKKVFLSRQVVVNVFCSLDMTHMIHLAILNPLQPHR